MREEFVYRLLTEPLWVRSIDSGSIAKTDLDITDGFIHLSTAGQLILTANLHFQDQPLLRVAVFKTADLLPFLKWEAVEGRWDEMPHYYNDLSTEFIVKNYTLNRNPGGSFGIITTGEA